MNPESLKEARGMLVEAFEYALQRDGQAILPVSGVSMEPTLSAGDMVTVRHADHLSADETPLKPGDIVLFRTADGSEAYLHRCVWLCGGRVWQMGDAQGTATPIQATAVIGVAVSAAHGDSSRDLTARTSTKAMLRTLRMRHMKNRAVGLVKKILGIQGHTGLLTGDSA